MKKRSIYTCLSLLLCLLLLLGGCGAGAPSPAVQDNAPEGSINDAENTPGTQPPAAGETADILVVWFSATGTTKDVAQRLAAHLSADLYEIVPETPYSAADLDYTDNGSRTSAEQNDASARPAIADALPDMQGYDTVLLGYPIWHGQAPRIISTFLEGCDLAGKTVIPFCTSASSGIGASAAALQPLAKDASWADGARFAADASDAALAAWADDVLPRSDESIAAKPAA